MWSCFSIRCERCIPFLKAFRRFKRYCGILPYFGRASYIYQRMPMGLDILPSIWQLYINTILECLQSRKHCEAITDDLLLFTPSKKAHMSKLEDLLKALLKNSLKISPRKYQLFKTELQYIGNVKFITDQTVCVKPLRSRLKAITKIKATNNTERLQKFHRDG